MLACKKKSKGTPKARDYNILLVLRGEALGRHKVFKDKTKYTRKVKHKGVKLW